jgi:predicted MFS family arabinose efflux permease
LAAACGAAVANLYYAQPLLHTIAVALHTSSSTAALLVTASQLGYAGGLMLIVPLGDIVDRRRLVSRMLLVAAVGLGAAAAAPSLAVLALAIAVAGVTSTVAQVLVPFASQLAGEEERGRIVGQVMSGLLIGILLARTFSGLVAAVAGWRVVFVAAAVAMVALSVALWRALPAVPNSEQAPYLRLLGSVIKLVRGEPLLRLRMVYGGLGMASFTILWTSLALLLSRPPFDYGAGVIGLFGLAGLAGAGAAQAAGKAADRGGAAAATGFFLVAILAGWGLIALGANSVLALLAGIVVLDLGVQGQHILNQTTIYELLPQARSRLTTAYMTSNFLCGAASSAAAAAAWSRWQWNGICGLGGILACLALAVWITERMRSRNHARVVEKTLTPPGTY